MRYSTITSPPPGRECKHPCCGNTCRKKSVPTKGAPIKKSKPKAPSAELERWFESRRSEMTGYCLHCGGKTAKKDKVWYKSSICHILPKRLFKSVATHPLNWIELCMWGNNCHGNMDNNTLDLIDMNCFDTIIKRFVTMYPEIDPKERRYIPDVLMQYVEVET